MTVENQAKLAQSHYWRLQTAVFSPGAVFSDDSEHVFVYWVVTYLLYPEQRQERKISCERTHYATKKKEKVISKYPNSYVHQNELLIYKYMTEMTESNIIETSTSSLEYWSTEIQ